MLRQAREHLIATLWKTYRANSAQIQRIETGLQKKNCSHFVLDHFAVIDLPGSHSGIPVLKEIFEILGYRAEGQGYLPDKQNDFLWLAEEESRNQLANKTLPQVVVADFRLHELPKEVEVIVKKYASKIPPPPLAQIKTLVKQLVEGEIKAKENLLSLLAQYFSGRDWPLPSVQEFLTVQAFNELLAWVLVFGRKPNHFTFSVHLLPLFSAFSNFLHFIEKDLALPLNTEGGKIKGGKASGIAQSSTQGFLETTFLADGEVEIPCDFVEFVWRYAKTIENPSLWGDYFTGFVAAHADHVIQSLYFAPNQVSMSSPTS